MANLQQGHPERQGNEETDLNKIINLLKRPESFLEGVRRFQLFISSLSDKTLPDLKDSPITLIAKGLSSLTDDKQKYEGLCVIYDLVDDKWRDDFVPALKSLIPLLLSSFVINNDSLCTKAFGILECAARQSNDLKSTIQKHPLLVEAIYYISTDVFAKNQTFTEDLHIVFLLAAVFDDLYEIVIKHSEIVSNEKFLYLVFSILHTLLDMGSLKTSIQILVPMLSGYLHLDSSNSLHRYAHSTLTKLVKDDKRVDEIMTALCADPENTSPVPIFTIIEALMKNDNMAKVIIQKNVLDGVLKWPLTDDLSYEYGFKIFKLAIRKYNKPHHQIPPAVFSKAKDYLNRDSLDRNAFLAALDLLAFEPRDAGRCEKRHFPPCAVLAKLFQEAGSPEEKDNVLRAFREYCRICRPQDLRYILEKCRGGPVVSGILHMVERKDAMNREKVLNDQDDVEHEDSGNEEPVLKRRKAF